MTEESETKVLIVEDEAHIAAGLKLNLELEGYSVDVAKTGREAGEFLLNAQRYGGGVLMQWRQIEHSNARLAQFLFQIIRIQSGRAHGNGHDRLAKTGSTGCCR